MDVFQYTPARGRVKIDGGGSATAFGLIAGARWVLTAAAIFWANLTSSVTVSLYDIDSTNSSQFVQFMASSTNGFCQMALEDTGIQASATGTRLVFNTGAVAGTFTALFTGYYTGG
jgi:hypothetical protein